MPDRYGEHPDTDPQLPLDDAELQTIALTVPCPYCHADRGQPCINQTIPERTPTRIPHIQRSRHAQEVPF